MADTRIRVDWDKKVIHWGDLHTQKYYVQNLTWQYLSQTLGRLVKPGKCGTKEGNKELADKLQCRPKVYASKLRAVQFDVWVEPYKDYITKFCVRKGKISQSHLYTLHKNLDMIKQYEADGLHHLTPFAFAYGHSTKEMKEMVGKSYWKQLCKNSYTRNRLLTNIQGQIDMWIDVPSTILEKQMRGYYYESKDLLDWVTGILKKQRRLKYLSALYQDRSLSFEHLGHIFFDTKRMCKQLGRPFNPKWSLLKMMTRHDDYAKEIGNLTESPDYLLTLDKVCVKTYSNDRFTAELLDSRFKIKEQGRDQHHCVGNYAEMVAKGGYLVYDIKEGGKTTSTLGIRRTHKIRDEDLKVYNQHGERFHLDQHYHYADRPIEDEELRAFGQEIVLELNKKPEDEEEILWENYVH